MFIKAANNVKFSYSITIKCIIKNEESEELRKCVKQHSQYAEKPIFFLLYKENLHIVHVSFVQQT